MNLNKKTFALLCASLFVATACQEIDNTPHGKLPKQMGDITLSSSRIGAGQRVVASAPLAVGGENINTVDYFWAFSETGMHHAPYRTENGVSWFEFLAPSTPGDYQVIFGGNYIFLGPDVDGKANAQKTVVQSYTVVPCDLLTSFWGDSTTETLNVVPNTKKIDADLCRISLRHWVDYSSSSSTGSTTTNSTGGVDFAPTHQRDYIFSSDKLVQVKDYCYPNRISYTQGQLLSRAARGFLGVEQNYIQRVYGQAAAPVMILDVAAGTQTAVDMTKLTDAAYADPIGARMLAGEVQLICSYSFGKVNLRTSVSMPSSDSFMLLREYTPKQ